MAVVAIYNYIAICKLCTNFYLNFIFLGKSRKFKHPKHIRPDKLRHKKTHRGNRTFFVSREFKPRIYTGSPLYYLALKCIPLLLRRSFLYEGTIHNLSLLFLASCLYYKKQNLVFQKSLARE